MSKPNRQDLKAEFWAHVPKSIEGYSDRIEVLLDALTDKQLRKVCRNINADDDEDVDADNVVSRRFALYDIDAGGLITTTLYPSYDAACEDSSGLNDVLILPVEVPADEAEEDDEAAENS